MFQKFSYNSTYAFSENRLNDGIELEGAEFYKPRLTHNDGTRGKTLGKSMLQFSKLGLNSNGKLFAEYKVLHRNVPAYFKDNDISILEIASGERKINFVSRPKGTLGGRGHGSAAVSYTHLTLPTILLV